jgi:hypothetical protein
MYAKKAMTRTASTARLTGVTSFFSGGSMERQNKRRAGGLSMQNAGGAW